MLPNASINTNNTNTLPSYVRIWFFFSLSVLQSDFWQILSFLSSFQPRLVTIYLYPWLHRVTIDVFE